MKESLAVIENPNRFVNHSQVKNIISDIQYQDNSIVSKVVIKKPSGNVTVFAFDKDEALSPHSAPFDALVQVLDGTAEIMIDKNFYELNSGDIIIMPAGIVHGVKAKEKFKMLLTMLKSE
ncbi:cupin domain-containing protein [Candidatus Kapaibacterium sp.]